MSKSVSLLVLACLSFGLVGALSGNSLAVEIQSNTNRQILDNNGNPFPVIRIYYKPPLANDISNFKSVDFAGFSIPSEASTSQNFYFTDYNGGRYLYLIYDPIDDVVFLRSASTNTTVRNAINFFVGSSVYNSFVRQDDTIDFLNVEGLTGTISQSVGKMIAVGLLLGIGLLSFKVGLTSLDKFLDDKFWRVRFENERSALEKDYKRLSRVYRDDPKGQKNLDRRFARRNARLYEKYADYGVEIEDLIRTE